MDKTAWQTRNKKENEKYRNNKKQLKEKLENKKPNIRDAKDIDPLNKLSRILRPTAAQISRQSGGMFKTYFPDFERVRLLQLSATSMFNYPTEYIDPSDIIDYPDDEDKDKDRNNEMLTRIWTKTNQSIGKSKQIFQCTEEMD